MKKLIVLITMLVISITVNSQITVDTTTNWVPTNLEVGGYDQIDSLTLDINQDGIDDLKFNVIVEVMFGEYCGFTVTSLNGAEILSHPLEPTYPFGMQMNDIVQYSTAFIPMTNAILTKIDNFNGDTYGYFYNNEIKYLGVKIDTFYGYVAILPVDYFVMKIKGYAFENLVVNVENTTINDDNDVNYIYNLNGQFLGKYNEFIPSGIYIIVNDKSITKKYINKL